MKRKVWKYLAISAAAAMLCCGCGKAPEGSVMGSAEEESAPAAEEETEAVTENEDAAPEEAVADTADEAEGTADTAEDESAPADGDTAAAADETTAEDETDYSKRDLFADFLKGVGSAVVADDFVNEVRLLELDKSKGQTFDAYELLQSTDEDGLVPNAEVTSSYAPLECHGEIAYVLKHYYESDRENVTAMYVFFERGDKLEMVMALDGWSRRGISINENGVIFDGGSNGAGSHSDTIYAPDDNFSYKVVSDVCEQFYGYNFYDENGNPMEGLNATMKEAGEGEIEPTDVAYYGETIDGKTYYYFLGTGKLTQKTVDYIDAIASKHNFRFDGKAAADEARNAYEEKLGVTEAMASI